MTFGDAEPAIRELWDTLAANRGPSLATLLRLAEARYVSSTVGDAFALAPLVKVAFCERLPLEHGPRLGHRTIHEVIDDLVLAWLRGMITVRVQPDDLRQGVRDTILADDRPGTTTTSPSRLSPRWAQTLTIVQKRGCEMSPRTAGRSESRR